LHYDPASVDEAAAAEWCGRRRLSHAGTPGLARPHRKNRVKKNACRARLLRATMPPSAPFGQSRSVARSIFCRFRVAAARRSSPPSPRPPNSTMSRESLAVPVHERRSKNDHGRRIALSHLAPQVLALECPGKSCQSGPDTGSTGHDHQDLV
jgi:hypothetical protein